MEGKIPLTKSPSIYRKFLILQDDPQGRLGDERPPGELRCQETSLLQTQCDEVNQVSILCNHSYTLHIHAAYHRLKTIKMVLIERATRARRMAQAQAVTTVWTFFVMFAKRYL